MSNLTDLIAPEDAKHLHGLFLERVRRSPNKTAYQFYNQHSQQWQQYSWLDVKSKVISIQHALKKLKLNKGDCVSIMLNNCPEWIMFEQAALSLGLVVVPLYPNDRIDNVKYILSDAKIRVLFVAGIEQSKILDAIKNEKTDLALTLCLHSYQGIPENIDTLENWIKTDDNIEEETNDIDPNQLASIVYTSGTTGRPKGVMLSHTNILQNTYGASQCESFLPTDSYLSFLPLSHMFERTVGYYLPMMSGGLISYARSIDLLAEDLLNIKPTILVTVPRIFERVYNKIQLQLTDKPKISQFLFKLSVDVGWHWFLYSQNRANWHVKLLLRPLCNKLVANKILKKLGGQLRLAISGGAALSPDIARTFIGLGLNISQGYGMTEASPVVCTNLLHDNEPSSVGQKFCNIEVKLGDDDELLVKGPSVMFGYLNNKEATEKTIDKSGWLHTGDKATIIRDHIYITGRIKDILVLSTGEKVPPNDIELAITNHPLFEQAIVLGEAKPSLTAIVVLNEIEWNKCQKLLSDTELDINSEKAKEYIINNIKNCLHDFPGYARIYNVYSTFEAWTVENGLTTPTLKLKRKYIIEKYQTQIDKMYEGH